VLKAKSNIIITYIILLCQIWGSHNGSQQMSNNVLEEFWWTSTRLQGITVQKIVLSTIKLIEITFRLTAHAMCVWAIYDLQRIATFWLFTLKSTIVPQESHFKHLQYLLCKTWENSIERDVQLLGADTIHSGCSCTVAYPLQCMCMSLPGTFIRLIYSQF
jgi:hypothetical protein